jgi:thiamine kinase-like enzyme
MIGGMTAYSQGSSRMNEPLNQSDIVTYLMRAKLINPVDVCNSDVLVTDASRRNYNLKVLRKHGTSYFVKQCTEPHAAETLSNEAQIYDMLFADSKYQSLTSYLPRYYGYDAAKQLIIFELLGGDAEDLDFYHARGHFSKTVARATARGLAELHKPSIFAPTESSANGYCSHELPWVFSISRPSLSQFRELSIASRQVVEIIQRYEEFSSLIDMCAEHWHATCLIHGDVKWANLIIYSSSGSGRKTQLKIVDWEYSGFGDPCWDIGSVFSAYINCWVMSMPMSPIATPAHWEMLSQFPLRRMQPAMRSFWETYVSHMNLSPTQSNSMLWRSILFSAVRLVQTAIERMQNAIVLSTNVVCLLQVAANMLSRPLETMVHLIGINLKADLSYA